MRPLSAHAIGPPGHVDVTRGQSTGPVRRARPTRVRSSNVFSPPPRPPTITTVTFQRHGVARGNYMYGAVGRRACSSSRTPHCRAPAAAVFVLRPLTIVCNIHETLLLCNVKITYKNSRTSYVFLKVPISVSRFLRFFFSEKKKQVLILLIGT